MKKKVLAVAVTTLLAAPFAAQSATTLFGHAHASIDVLSADGAAGAADEDGIAVSDNSSRIGVKGSHKFSDSLSGIYHMEWGVRQDGEGSSMSKRNRIVGLTGGFGTFVLGRHDTPMKVIGRKVDLFWSTQLGQNRSLTAVGDGGAGFDARVNNVIGYISPNFGPFHIFAAYVTDHGIAGTVDSTVSEDNDNDAYSIAAILGGGKSPYFLAVGTEEHNIDGTAAGSESAVRATGYYKIGAAKLVGFYQAGTDLGGVNGADRDIMGLGGSFKAGSNTFKATYYVADDLGGAADTGASLVSLGVDHNLSKSTAIYANYAAVANDDNAAFKLGGAGHNETATPVAGGDANGFSLGMRLKF